VTHAMVVYEHDVMNEWDAWMDGWWWRWWWCWCL